jgi:hypothetical protein
MMSALLLLCFAVAVINGLDVLKRSDLLNFYYDGVRLLSDFVPPETMAELRALTVERYSAMERQYLSDGFQRHCPDRTEELLNRVKLTFSDAPNIEEVIASCPGDWSDAQFVGLIEDDGIRRILSSPRFAEAAALLLGVKSVRLYGDAPFFKDPRQPNRLNDNTPWHRDLFFVPAVFEESHPRTFLTFWCPLDDIGPDDALLRFAVGSHRTDDLLERWHDASGVDQFDIRPSTSEPIMRAGTCTVHHGALWHGSDGQSRGTKLRAAIGFSFIDAAARKLDVAALDDEAREKMEQGSQSFAPWYNRVAVGDVIDALPVAWPTTAEAQTEL